MTEPAQFPKPEPEREERTPRPHDDAPCKPGPAETQAEPEPEPGRAAEDFQARIDKLLDAANTASGHVRNVYLTFLLFGLYLAIIFGSTTHEQLLRESPVTLPLLDVGLPLVGFYWLAPALFLLLHLNLLLQLYLLSGKLHRLDHALDEAIERGHLHQDRADEERTRLYPYPFSQMLIGRQHGRSMRFLLWLVVWLTVLVLPVVLLLAGQVRFLPYHDAWTTMWHRFLVAADLLLILIFWRPIRHPGDRLLRHPARWLWHQAKAASAGLVALALSFLILTFPGDPDDPDHGDLAEEWLLAVVPERRPAFDNGLSTRTTALPADPGGVRCAAVSEPQSRLARGRAGRLAARRGFRRGAGRGNGAEIHPRSRSPAPRSPPRELRADQSPEGRPAQGRPPGREPQGRRPPGREPHARQPPGRGPLGSPTSRARTSGPPTSRARTSGTPTSRARLFCVTHLWFGAPTSRARTSLAPTSMARTSLASTSRARTSGTPTSRARTSGTPTSGARTSGTPTSRARTCAARISGACGWMRRKIWVTGGCWRTCAGSTSSQ